MYQRPQNAGPKVYKRKRGMGAWLWPGGGTSSRERKRAPRPAPRGPRPRRLRPMQNGPSSGHRLYKKGKPEYCDRVAPSELGGCRSQGLGRGPGRPPAGGSGGRGREVARAGDTQSRGLPRFPAEGYKVLACLRTPRAAPQGLAQEGKG